MFLKFLEKKRGGYFVELASNDWKVYSNSLTLEYFYHWDGICIEPNKKVYLQELIENRRCHIYTNPVSSSTGTEMKFRFSNLGHGGLIGNEFDNRKANDAETVYTVTLEYILDHAKAPHIIDYLSLDVEGAEYHAVVNLNFKKYLFLIMTIERPTQKLHHFLVIKGYRFVYRVTDYGECPIYSSHTA